MTRRRSGGIAGITATAVLVCVFVGLTLHEVAFLGATGWDPIRRSAVEWPSVLELGPAGELEIAAFVVAGALGLVLGVSLVAAATGRRERIGGAALAVMSLGVAAMAFPPDGLRGNPESWHAIVHNAVYPAIPLSALVAAAALGIGRSDRVRGSVVRASRIFLGVGAVALSLTAVDAIAQVARYFVFGPLLLWFLAVSVASARTPR